MSNLKLLTQKLTINSSKYNELDSYDNKYDIFSVKNYILKKIDKNSK